MKWIQLFEEFVFENSGKSLPHFEMPDLYVMPTGLSRNRVYLIRLINECSNLIYALVDLTQLEQIYRALNLHLIAEKIWWYQEAISYPRPKTYVPEGSDGDPTYPREALMRRSWTIELVAEEQGGKFPYYVYFGGADSTGGLRKKLEELEKKCKVCGDPPEIISGPPTCALGSDQFVIFDPEMSLGLTREIFSNDEPNDHYNNPLSTEATSYYVKFDALGGFLATWHPSHFEFDRRYVRTEFIVVDNSQIFELLPYRQHLHEVKKNLAHRQNAAEFMDRIFGYLIDAEVPTPLIETINGILNREDYVIEQLKFHRVKVDNFKKRQLTRFSDPVQKFSPTPDFKNATFILALPGDEKITQAILRKLPRTYSELMSGLKDLSSAELEKIKSTLKFTWSGQNLEHLIRNLRHSIYIPQLGSVTEQEYDLSPDTGLPSQNVFLEETHCNLIYGIYQDLTLEQIAALSPIELYLSVFYGRGG